MRNFYWNEDSWGSMCPPANAAEIICAANGLIDDYAESHPDADDWEIDEYSNDLWEQYSRDDSICGISNVYDDAD